MHKITITIKPLYYALFFLAITPILSYAACEVTLRWDSVSGSNVAGYRLFYRQAGQTFDYRRPVWQGTATQCTVNQLDEDTLYYFAVRAFDTQGTESANSNEIQFLFDNNPPTRPNAVSPEDGAQDVSLEPEMISGPFNDLDRNDRHNTTEWQIFRAADSLPVFKLDSSDFLINLPLPPLVLDGSTSYYWTIRHANQRDTFSEQSPPSYFTTAAWTADQNGNGIPDRQEMTTNLDLDNDGANDTAQTDLKCVQTVNSSVYAGVSIRRSQSVAALEAIQAIDDATITPPLVSAVTLPVGLINFRLFVDEPGCSTAVTIHFSNTIPAQYRWIMFDPANGYQDHTPHSRFAADRQAVNVELQDGGYGDMDGVANGFIVGLGGYGRLSGSAHNAEDGTSSGSGGGSGGACFIESLVRP